jgi:hypothetical protein
MNGNAFCSAAKGDAREAADGTADTSVLWAKLTSGMALMACLIIRSRKCVAPADDPCCDTSVSFSCYFFSDPHVVVGCSFSLHPIDLHFCVSRVQYPFWPASSHFASSCLLLRVVLLSSVPAGIVMQAANPMTNAVSEFADSNPELASRGIGVTTNAERWNGRHAMFGMFFMTFTAYLKGHGLIPDADKVLDINQWGPLAYAGFGQVITNERAIILVAHIHVLFVSIICAFSPLAFQVPECPDPDSASPESMYSSVPQEQCIPALVRPPEQA